MTTKMCDCNQGRFPCSCKPVTTNQTIDGVPRAQLAAIADRIEHNYPNTAKELRALLDAPVERVEVVQADNAGQALTLLDFALSFALCNMDHDGTRRDVKKAQAHLESYLKFKAAQPQGEPVAYADPKAFENFGSLAHLGGLYAREWMWANPADGLVALYTEQPAPVSVQVSWSDVEPWYLANEQRLSDIRKFEGLKGFALEVWRGAKLNGAVADGKARDA